MPIYERGYRHWEGPLRSKFLRWWTITRTGWRLGLQGKLIRRLLFASWVPLTYFVIVFFAIGVVTDPQAEVGEFSREVAEGFFGDALAGVMQTRPDLTRPLLWAVVFSFYLSYFQLFVAIVVTAIISPSLVSRDIKSKAFLVYFSKPITRIDYLIGKSGIVLGYVFWVTLLPALVLYVISIVFAPTMDVVGETVLTIPRIFMASLVIAVPLTAFGLFMSSLSSDERLPQFGFITVWVLGEVAYQILRNTGRELASADWIVCFSVRESIQIVVLDIFGPAARFDAIQQKVPGMLEAIPEHGFHDDIVGLTAATDATVPAVWLGAVTVVCFVGLARRVAAPVRV